MNTSSRSRGAVLALVLLLSAVSAFAQTAPSFLIERIDVRNLRRASPQVVRSESLLREGVTYTERELQDAQSRIRRLPFVLDVDFSLEKGSQRDSYVLVMKVDEAAPFFVGVNHVTYPASNGRPKGENTDVDVGLRWFVGEYGQVHASLGGDIENEPRDLSVGYTQYDLFGRSIFLSVTGYSDLLDNIESLGATGVLGVPLRGNHALRLELAGYKSDRRELGHDVDSEGLSSSLGWIYDTTNDALFPTDGLKLNAGVSRSRSESTGIVLLQPDGDPQLARFESTGTGVQLSGTKLWPVRELDAISMQLQVGGTRSTLPTVTSPGGPGGPSTPRTDYLQANATLAYSGSFWGLDRTRRFGDLRYEAGLRGWVSQFSRDLPGIGDTRYEELGAVTGIAHRNRWGLFRVSVSWSLASSATVRR